MNSSLQVLALPFISIIHDTLYGWALSKYTLFGPFYIPLFGPSKNRWNLVLPQIWVCQLLRAGVCVGVPECFGQPDSFVSPWGRIGRLRLRLGESESRVQEPGLFTRGSRTNLAFLHGGFPYPLLRAWNRGRYPGILRAAGFFCISLGAHRAAASPLRGIGKPDSG